MNVLEEVTPEQLTKEEHLTTTFVHDGDLTSLPKMGLHAKDGRVVLVVKLVEHHSCGLTDFRWRFDSPLVRE